METNFPPDQSCDTPVLQVPEDQVFVDGDDIEFYRRNSDLSPKKCVVSFDGARYTIGKFHVYQ